MAINLHYYALDVNGSFSQTSDGGEVHDVLDGYKYDAFTLVVMGVLGSIVNISGFILSLLILITLSRMHPKSSVLLVLIAVAYTDLVVLLLGEVLVFLPRAFGYLPSMTSFVMFVEFDYGYLYPIKDMALISNAWLLVLLALERYIVNVRPSRRAEWTSRRRVLGSIGAIFVSAIVFDVPKFFEYHTITHHEAEPHQRQIRIEGSRLHDNKLFMWVYMFALDLLVRMVVPFVLLVVLSGLILKHLRAQDLANLPLKQRQKALMTKRVTVMSLLLFLIFLLVQFPYMLLAILHATHDENEAHPHYSRVVNAALFLQAVNAASKFYIYLLMSANFRDSLKTALSSAAAALVCRKGEEKSKTPRGLTTVKEEDIEKKRWDENE